MDAQARELRFLRRTPTGSLERAFLHPTSSCYAERSWPSPWAVYGECVETHRVSIRDCGGYPGLVKHGFDRRGLVRAHARVGALVAALRDPLGARPSGRDVVKQLDSALSDRGFGSYALKPYYQNRRSGASWSVAGTCGNPWYILNVVSSFFRESVAPRSPRKALYAETPRIFKATSRRT